jgi:hypothetical protein
MFTSSGIFALTADVDTPKKLCTESALGLPIPITSILRTSCR